MKKAYPGKPGPKPSGGLKRTIPFLVMLDADEFEYLHRLERNRKDLGAEPHKKVQIIRERTFRPGWQGVLARLRKSQGANIKP